MLKPRHLRGTVILAVACVCSVMPLVVQAQGSRASLSYAHRGHAKLKDYPDASITLQEFNLRTGYPVIKTDDTMLIAGLRFRPNRLHLSGTTPADIDLYGIALPLFVRHSWNERWSGIARVSAGIYTDFSHITQDDFRLFALAMAGYRLNDHWSFGFGAVVLPRFGEVRVFPGLDATWTPNDEWTLILRFPHSSITYQPAERFKLYLQAMYDGYEWSARVNEEDIRINFDGWRAGVGAELELGKGVWLSGMAGVDLGREFEVRGEGTTAVDTYAENAPVVQCGLSWR